jgi:hypothetical protein
VLGPKGVFSSDSDDVEVAGFEVFEAENASCELPLPGKKNQIL